MNLENAKNAFEAIRYPPTDGRPPFTPEMMLGETESYIDFTGKTYAEMSVSSDEDLPPVMLVGGIGGMIAVAIGEALCDEMGKAQLVASIRYATAKIPFIHSVALIVPSYISKLTKEDAERMESEGKLPDIYLERKEVITVLVEARDGLVRMGYADVTRTDAAPPSFGKVEWTIPEKASGRLSGFFTNPSATEH